MVTRLFSLSPGQVPESWVHALDGYRFIAESAMNPVGTLSFSSSGAVLSPMGKAEVQETLKATSRWLVAGPAEENKPIRTALNSAFRRPTLYREFSDLGKSPEAILEFANEYGLLGRRTLLLADREKNLFVGESYENWVARIFEVRTIVELWRSLDDSLTTVDALSALRSNPNDQTFHYVAKSDMPPGSEFIGFGRSDLSTVSPKQESLGAPIRALIQKNVNAHIEKGLRLGVSLASPPRTSTYVNDLLGAIYFSLSRDLLAADAKVQCEQCGKSFVPERRGATLCSNSCRQKKYRENRKAKGGDLADA